MMEKKEGIAVYIYRMQDKRDDKSQSPLFLSRAAARYAFGEGGEGPSKEASFRVEKGLRGKPYFPEYPWLHFSISHSGDFWACAMAAQVLRACAVGNVLFWPLAFTLPNSLRAAGDAIFTMAVSLGSMFVCRVVLSYVFACAWGLNLGLLGVWLAMIADWVVRAAFFLFRYWRGRWKRIRVI